jgi:hypothetical protein
MAEGWWAMKLEDILRSNQESASPYPNWRSSPHGTCSTCRCESCSPTVDNDEAKLVTTLFPVLRSGRCPENMWTP